jgi:hypothetical protein
MDRDDLRALARIALAQLERVPPRAPLLAKSQFDI